MSGAPSPSRLAPTNLVVLVGTISGDVQTRAVGTSTAYEFDVAVDAAPGVGSGGRRSVVPVNWIDPPAAATELIEPDLEVVVTGSIHRRFFRAGGRTQSRTEVIPERVVPLRRRASVRSALSAAAARLA